MFDLISIGDATEDVFMQLKEAEVHCELGTSKCTICMAFATKIPIDRVDKLIGGNAANVAVGGKRLGMKSALYCVLGNDEQGRLIRDTMKKEGVSTKYVQLKKGTATNYSVVINYGPERTILVHHEPRKYALPKLDKSRWVYYTSTGAGFQRLHKPLLKYIKKYNARFGFNPGTHQMRAGTKVLSPLLKASEVLFLNKEETQLVVKSESNDFKVLLRKMKALGPKIAVATDGPNGSYAYDGSEFYFQDIFDVPVIERTGCGDSYSTGFVAALFHGETWQDAMKWGTLNAASVLQKIGPEAGLAKLSWIKKKLKQHPEFRPAKF
ncbi:carbohydrate kinase family protein [Candidatus Woesearchaeota archaeon]|nr:carbohydrate kinase family protein [Candidatus Woesearchaeota archaeon]